MSIYDFNVLSSNGEQVSLSTFKGKVLLIVNTASKCGFTSQYSGLTELYHQFSSQGFEILAFPCNQFGAQEPGSAEEIQEFCSLNFDVKFPIMKKINVNGEDADPLFKQLKKSAPGILGTTKIKWNFTKFLIDQDGHVVKRFAPKYKPEKLIDHIKSLL